MNRDISHIRKDYIKDSLDIDNADKNPLKQFNNWFLAAQQKNLLDYNAMVLSTVSDGKPSARVVLLKGLLNEGFVFYTNYNSRKGKELEENKNVSLTFFWPEFERQVRVEGIAEKVSEEMSDEYFNSRPLDSRIGAIASPQSKVISSREELEKAVNEAQESSSIERPDYWGGYIVKPTVIEFWQGRANRLHDRLIYTLSDNWKIERLAP